jgi:hypothetical protein
VFGQIIDLTDRGPFVRSFGDLGFRCEAIFVGVKVDVDVAQMLTRETAAARPGDDDQS